jgi:hypothetical protein
MLCLLFVWRKKEEKKEKWWLGVFFSPSWTLLAGCATQDFLWLLGAIKG